MINILDIIQKEGLSLFNIINPITYPEIEKKYKNWIDNNYHGTMTYIGDHISLKVNPQKILPGCRSIIITGLNYNVQAKNSIDKTHGRIAKYAWARDYHKVLGKKLKNISRQIDTAVPGTKSRSFTDATPLLESHYAITGGLGFKGKNSLVINPKYGSWFFIGEILTTKHFTLENDNSMLVKNRIFSTNCNQCINCKRCIKACPTGAIIDPYIIDASKCISYLTIEYDGIIPVPLRSKMKNWIFGCDICQYACPHNKNIKETEVQDFKRYIAGQSIDLRKILEIKNDEEFLKLFAGSPLMRAKRIKLIRNACIAAATNKLYELLPLLKKLKSNEHNIIKEHAAWAVSELENSKELNYSTPRKIL